MARIRYVVQWLSPHGVWEEISVRFKRRDAAEIYAAHLRVSWEMAMNDVRMARIHSFKHRFDDDWAV